MFSLNSRNVLIALLIALLVPISWGWDGVRKDVLGPEVGVVEAGRRIEGRESVVRPVPLPD